jgi:ATP-dependent DNA helicase 2 subunit 1
MTKWVCNDTGALLMKEQIAHYYPYGGERIRFSKEELQDIKTIDKPGLRLMGFKPRSALKSYYNIKSASFIYPDESV